MDYLITARVPASELGKAIDGVTPYLSEGHAISIAVAPAEISPRTRVSRGRAFSDRGPNIRPIHETGTGRAAMGALRTGEYDMTDLKNAMAIAGFKESSASGAISGIIREGLAEKTLQGTYRLTDAGKELQA